MVGKLEYKKKIEEHFQTNKKMWKGLNVIRGYNKDKGNQVTSNYTDNVNVLIRLKARFDCHDFGCEREGIRVRLANAPSHVQCYVQWCDQKYLALKHNSA